jgi:hypothetical protein
LQHDIASAKLVANKQLSELSASARLVLGVQEVAGSNPVAPTVKTRVFEEKRLLFKGQEYTE